MPMSQPFIRHDPAAPAIPLVCDSPHSGTEYPADFGHVVSLEKLRQGEDTHVDALWKAVPEVGGTLLAALFPRTYIDPNRTLVDLDPTMIEGEWPEPLSPGVKTVLGKGLIWSRMDTETPIYNRQLSIQEVRSRIDSYYQPYHDALGELVERRYADFGALWHLNLHSMPSDAYRRLGMDPNRNLADFVLGDRDGTTCGREFVDLIASSLRDKGYSVAVNDPYKGVQLIAKIGDPEQNRHSLQIEINRAVYMDEVTREPNESFDRLQHDLNDLLREVAQYIRSRTGVSQ